MPANKIKRIGLVILLLIFLVYLATGIYTVQNGQNALTLRFGKVVVEVINPGINYHLPFPLEKVIKVHVRQVRKIQIQQSEGKGIEGITGDENLITILAVVSYDINNLTDYVFQANDVEGHMQVAGEMCLSAELAKVTVDEVMTSGKSILRFILKQKIQAAFDSLGIGIRVISLELTDISPPPNVSLAFKAVSDAREKKQRIIKEAEGYAYSKVPKARGEASSILFQASAYANETINLAYARTEAFTALEAEYMKNPDIIAKQKYLETLNRIYQKCSVIIDSNPENSVYYIGEDGKIIREGG